MKALKRIKDWWFDIGNCTDCGKREKLEILSHQFSAYHDILIKSTPAVCKFIGSHDKMICNECWGIFSQEMDAHWHLRGLVECPTGKHK